MPAPPVARRSVGVPTTVTDLLKLTWIDIVLPALYDAFDVDELTDVTVGITPSITMLLLAPKLFAAPGAASVKLASLPTESLIVMPVLTASAEVLE